MTTQLSIAVIAAAVTGGCIATPVDHIERRSALVGTAAGSPIRIGATTRAEIYARFGPPAYSTQHDMACGYLFTAVTGKKSGLFCGPCGFIINSYDITEMDDIWLAFDSNGVLMCCEKHLVDDCSGDANIAWHRFARTVSDPLRPNQEPNS